MDNQPFTFEVFDMPFTAEQIAIGANYTLNTFRKNDPIDQINNERPFLSWLLKNKEESNFGNGFHDETIYVSNGGNYQNYFGADAVTHNERDLVRHAKYAWYNHHDGFFFDEDRLAANGIQLSEDGDAMPTKMEKERLVDLLGVSYRGLKEGMNEGFNLEAYQNGAANAKAMPGLDHLVSTTPTVGTVGGLNAATSIYWRNNANLGIAPADLAAQMELSFRACTRYGKTRPDFILCGAAFLDAYRAQAGSTINRQIVVGDKGGTGMDLAITDAYFRGIPLVHDHTLEDLDVLDPGATFKWTKRCYFLSSKTIKFRPMKGFWMKSAKPEKLPERYVTYFGTRSKYGMSTAKRNSNAVLSIA
jgi:hypothetical protein